MSLSELFHSGSVDSWDTVFWKNKREHSLKISPKDLFWTKCSKHVKRLKISYFLDRALAEGPDERTETCSVSPDNKRRLHMHQKSIWNVSENFIVLRRDEKFCCKVYFKQMLFSFNKDGPLARGQCESAITCTWSMQFKIINFAS